MQGTRRLGVTVLAAALLHVLAVAALRVARPSTAVARTEAPLESAAFEVIADESPQLKEGASSSEAVVPAAAQKPASRPGARAEGIVIGTPGDSSNTEATAPSSEHERWSFDPHAAAPIDLGLHRGSVAVIPPPSATLDPSKGAERALRAALEERDVDGGLGRAGPLVNATREAAGSGEAPDTGATTLEIDTDGSGTVIAARAESEGWNGVAAAVVRRMTGKALRVPHGARGLRARVRVVAERSPPAGSRGTTALGAVPDDIPGGDQSGACVGTGLARRCTAGMPVGVTSAKHDTSNTGARVLRVVHVQLLSEAPL